ncbi:hypothetical protein CYMTET_7991 [Cymbomonas tetramitiformis]|uniref:Uncharacterized protein n=1 Tax=Cymbomonas tetramitiformis TaxID=36881 RepID=A0AAE0LGY0_9CHLO|nr:hypothetical protein CYMTET_7991 [Cymbomonas tetramitiformis]
MYLEDPSDGIPQLCSFAFPPHPSPILIQLVLGSLVGEWVIGVAAAECLVGNGGCDFRSECKNTAPGFYCGPCPDGYLTATSAEGKQVCTDVDECAADNGGCDPLSRCINTDGSRGCGPCPNDYNGDGYSGCWQAADCSAGPCDTLTTCDDTAGLVVCGACPEGYGGSGETQCEDLDGCDANMCFDDGDPAHKVECFDVEAPGIGYSCGECPYTYVGDGITCVEDKCITGTACSPLVTCSMLQSGEFACGSCPEGFYGDGRYDGIGIGCLDYDECGSFNGGCHHLTTCTNTHGGHECGACPEGYLGTGATSCNKQTDCSDNNGGCWTNGVESVTCEANGLEVVCGECPVGYVGDGYTGCIDEPGCIPGACATVCSIAECRQVVCRDVPAPGLGFQCDACPVGFLGDGQGENSTKADKVGCYENMCFNNNGGCSLKVDCTNNPSAPGGRLCGACPAGYVNKYMDGTVCEDENGCVVDPCFEGVTCTDLLAPLVGRTCGPCPGGYEGDGAICTDVDECAGDADPPFGGCFRDESIGVVTECTNVERSAGAPRGRLCGACPEGYKGSGETGCVLVTTCAMNNGGCWVGSGDYAEFSTACTDIPGVGTECGACPEGFEGTGDTGCVDIDGCAQEPCFPGGHQLPILLALTPSRHVPSWSREAAGLPPGVRCTDVRAPDDGRLCDYLGPVATVPWGCPEGYHGDGVECTLCRVSVQIVDSTVKDGVEQRAGWFKGQRTQLTGQLDGLNHPNCTNQQGTIFVWEGVASDESILNLTAARNKANTLKLSIPKRDLVVGLNYQLSLTAYMPGAPLVRDVSPLGFFVKSQPLITIIKGGNAVTGASNVLRLSAEESVDPDGEPGDMVLKWTCVRTDLVDATCRQSDSTPLPSRMTNTTIEFTLLGAVYGANYTFSLTATKSSRKTTSTTWLTVFDGEPPVVTVTPMVDKANPTDKITLGSRVESDDPGTLKMMWSCEGLELDSSMLMTTTAQEDLVLRPGVLTPGQTYLFELRATDSFGLGSAALEVEVNTAPRGGSVVVEPAKGVEMETNFAILSLGWVDEDAPLWYLQAYRVVGSGGATWSSLVSDFGTLPSPYRIFTMFPKAGLEEHNYLMEVRVTVMDALGAMSTAQTNITVLEAEEVNGDALLGSAADRLRNGDTDGSARYIAGLSAALNDAAYARYAEQGDAAWHLNSTDGYYYYYGNSSGAPMNASTSTVGLAAPAPSQRRVLSTGGAAGVVALRRRLFAAPEVIRLRRRRRLLTADGEQDDGSQAAAQRTALLGMVEDMQGMLFTTSASTATLAETVGDVVGAPCELNNDTQTGAMGMVDGLIAGSRDGGDEAKMSSEAAAHMAGALSNLNEAGQAGACAFTAPGNASSDAVNADLEREAAANRTAEVQRKMAALGETLLKGVVDGEDAQQVASPTLALSTQRCRSDLADSCIYTRPLSAPGGGGASSASFPPSLGAYLAAQGGDNDAGRRLLGSEALASNCTNCTQTGVVLPRQSVDTRLISSATEAHFVYVELPAWGDTANRSGDSDSDRADGPHADSDAEMEPNATDASGSTSVVILGADGRELNISGLNEGVVVEIELSPELGGLSVREVEGLAGVPWVGYVNCRFWDQAIQRYSSAGCVGLPNPAPAGAELFWRSRDVGASEELSMEMLWGVGNMALTAGCEEVWAAAVPEFNGTDDGLRKYGNFSLEGRGGNFTAAGCKLVDPDNGLECYWDWTLQYFTGPGCVVTAAQSCLCTHLTDFKAQNLQDTTRREPPNVQVASMDQMTSLTLADLLASTLLLTIVGGLMGGALYFAVMSTWKNNAERQAMLEQLLRRHGTGTYGFKSLAKTWTWGILEEENAEGVAKKSTLELLEDRAKPKPPANAKALEACEVLYGLSPKKAKRGLLPMGRSKKEREREEYLTYKRALLAHSSFQQITGSLRQLPRDKADAALEWALQDTGITDQAHAHLEGGRVVGAAPLEVRLAESVTQPPRSFGDLTGTLDGELAEHRHSEVGQKGSDQLASLDGDAAVTYRAQASSPQPVTEREMALAVWAREGGREANEPPKTYAELVDSLRQEEQRVAADATVSGLSTARPSVGLSASEQLALVHQQGGLVQLNQRHQAEYLLLQDTLQEPQTFSDITERLIRTIEESEEEAEEEAEGAGEGGEEWGDDPTKEESRLLPQLYLKPPGDAEDGMPSSDMQLVLSEMQEPSLAIDAQAASDHGSRPGSGLRSRPGSGGLDHSQTPKLDWRLRQLEALEGLGDTISWRTPLLAKYLEQIEKGCDMPASASSELLQSRRQPAPPPLPPQREAAVRITTPGFVSGLKRVCSWTEHARGDDKKRDSAGKEKKDEASSTVTQPGAVMEAWEGSEGHLQHLLRDQYDQMLRDNGAAAGDAAVDRPTLPRRPPGCFAPASNRHRGNRHNHHRSPRAPHSPRMHQHRQMQASTLDAAPVAALLAEEELQLTLRGRLANAAAGSATAEVEEEEMDMQRQRDGKLRMFPLSKPPPLPQDGGEDWNEAVPGNSLTAHLLGEERTASSSSSRPSKLALSATRSATVKGALAASRVSSSSRLGTTQGLQKEHAPSAASRVLQACVQERTELDRRPCHRLGTPLESSTRSETRSAVKPTPPNRESSQNDMPNSSVWPLVERGVDLQPPSPSAASLASDPIAYVQNASLQAAYSETRLDPQQFGTHPPLAEGSLLPLGGVGHLESVGAAAGILTHQNGSALPAEDRQASPDVPAGSERLKADRKGMSAMATEADDAGGSPRRLQEPWRQEEAGIDTEVHAESMGMVVADPTVASDGRNRTSTPSSHAPPSRADSRMLTEGGDGFDHAKAIALWDPETLVAPSTTEVMWAVAGGTVQSTTSTTSVEQNEEAQWKQEDEGDEIMAMLMSSGELSQGARSRANLDVQRGAKSLRKQQALMRKWEIARKKQQIARAATVSNQLGLFGTVIVKKLMNTSAQEMGAVMAHDAKLFNLKPRKDQVDRNRARKRRIAVKIKCYAVLVELLERSQNLHSTTHLCSILGFSTTALHVCIPLEAMRTMIAHGHHQTSYKRGQQEVPLERALGTALVLAFLRMRAIISERQVEVQENRARKVPWRLPSWRSFKWYEDVFRVMLKKNRNPQGWYHRSILWNFVFLQQSQGYYEPTDALARALHAGDTSATVATQVVPPLTVEGMLARMPEALSMTELPFGLAERLWATLLAEARLKLLPFGWVINPEEPPWRRRLLEDGCRDYLTNQEAQFPELKVMMNALAGEANLTVSEWRNDQLKAIEVLRKATLKGAAVAEALMSDNERSLRRKKWWIDQARLVVASHPWVAIAVTPATEPYSRAQRTLVQCNSLLVMLFITLMLFYSKGNQCCISFKDYLGCGPGATVDTVCWGHATCGELYRARDGDALPEFLNPHGHVCDAFPTESLVDKIWQAGIVLGIMIPINLMLMGLFTIGGTPVAPTNWVYGVHKKRCRSVTEGGRQHLGENLLFLVMTFLWDTRRLSRALARYFLMLAQLVDWTFLMLLRAARYARLRLAVLRNVLWTVFNISVLRRNPDAVLQELEIAAEIAAAIQKERDEALATFQVARHEMDSFAVQCSYLLLALLWVIVLWFQLTYAMLIREMLGSDAEKIVLRNWGFTVLADNLGVHVLKSVIIKLVVQAVTTQTRKYSKGEAGLVGWYEDYAAKYLGLTYTMASQQELVAEQATHDNLYG